MNSLPETSHAMQSKCSVLNSTRFYSALGFPVTADSNELPKFYTGMYGDNGLWNSERSFYIERSQQKTARTSTVPVEITVNFWNKVLPGGYLDYARAGFFLSDIRIGTKL